MSAPTSDTEPNETLKRPREESASDGTGTFGPIHLAVCLGAGGLVVLGINLLEWLK